jgi:hypothetical protein
MKTAIIFDMNEGFYIEKMQMHEINDVAVILLVIIG